MSANFLIAECHLAVPSPNAAHSSEIGRILRSGTRQVSLTFRQPPPPFPNQMLLLVLATVTQYLPLAPLVAKTRMLCALRSAQKWSSQAFLSVPIAHLSFRP